MVESFALSATTVGRRCTLLAPAPGGGRRPAMYFLDADLSSLVFSEPKEAGPTTGIRSPDDLKSLTILARAKLCAVEDIRSFEEDGESCFPPEVLANVSPEEQVRLVLVAHRTAQGMCSIFFLDESFATGAAFKEGLGVLVALAPELPPTTRDGA